MSDLARRIKSTTVPEGSLAIFWLAQARIPPFACLGKDKWETYCGLT